MDPDDVTLRGGLRIPRIGFGLYKVDDPLIPAVVRDALDVGFTLIDSAEFYGTESTLGHVLHDASPRPIVQSKFWGEPQGYDEALRAFDATHAAVGPVDSYLIHWPRAPRDRYVDTWRALIALRNEGRVTSIGVCNFNEDELARLGDETGELPALNQIELHPWLPQTALRTFHDAHGIVTQAWSPLARGRILDEPVVRDIATARGATPSQVVLAWHLSKGHTLVVKSTHRERMIENLDAAQLVLDADEVHRLDALENGTRTGTHPKDRP